MESYILQQDMELSSSSQDGTPISFKINVDKIHVIKAEHDAFIAIKRDLRDLSRAKLNLQNSLELISRIEGMVRSYGFSRDHKMELESHFCRVVILYGACFLKGGKPRMRPLKHDEFSKEEISTHEEIMDYRDKLFGHLDENHKVRSDQNNLQFSIENNKIVPLNVTVSGTRTIMTGQAFSERWKDHIQCLLENVNFRIFEKEQEMISFLKGIEIFVQNP